MSDNHENEKLLQKSFKSFILTDSLFSDANNDGVLVSRLYVLYIEICV